MRNLTVTAALMAAFFMSGCAILQPAASFTKERITEYCATTTPAARELLRQQLAHPDGSPMVQVFCEPHGEPS